MPEPATTSFGYRPGGRQDAPGLGPAGELGCGDDQAGRWEKRKKPKNAGAGRDEEAWARGGSGMQALFQKLTHKAQAEATSAAADTKKKKKKKHKIFGDRDSAAQDGEMASAPPTPPAAAAPAAYKRPTDFPSSWGVAELRPWQLEVNEMIQEPTNNTGIWLFDSQTYWGGRGKSTFFKHLMKTTDDVYYMTLSPLSEAEEIRGAIDYVKSVSKQNRVLCYRLARAHPHNAALYEVLEAVAPETHVVVACSFWPDLGLLPNLRWRLFEWDDYNNIHELPPGADPGGRVGLGNTNAGGGYSPFWNRRCSMERERELRAQLADSVSEVSNFISKLREENDGLRADNDYLREQVRRALLETIFHNGSAVALGEVLSDHGASYEYRSKGT